MKTRALCWTISLLRTRPSQTPYYSLGFCIQRWGGTVSLRNLVMPEILSHTNNWRSAGALVRFWTLKHHNTSNRYNNSIRIYVNNKNVIFSIKSFSFSRAAFRLLVLDSYPPFNDSLLMSLVELFSPKKRTKHRREIIAARGPFSPVSWRGQTHSSQTQKIRQSGGLGRKNLCGHTKLCVKFWHAAINFRREGNKGAGPISPAHL